MLMATPPHYHQHNKIFLIISMKYVQGEAKRTHVFESACDFFGVTSNQKSTFENFVQLTI